MTHFVKKKYMMLFAYQHGSCSRNVIIVLNTCSGISPTIPCPSFSKTIFWAFGMDSASRCCMSSGRTLSLLPIMISVGTFTWLKRLRSRILLVGCIYSAHVSLLTSIVSLRKACIMSSERGWGNMLCKSLFRSHRFWAIKEIHGAISRLFDRV